jgi:hypothetical protein
LVFGKPNITLPIPSSPTPTGATPSPSPPAPPSGGSGGGPAQTSAVGVLKRPATTDASPSQQPQKIAKTAITSTTPAPIFGAPAILGAPTDPTAALKSSPPDSHQEEEKKEQEPSS